MEYVYDMTWSEFIIRSYAYNRIQKNEWKKIRRIAYTALIAPYQNPKRIPRSEERWMKIGNEVQRSRISEDQKIRFLEATKEYLRQKNG